MAKKDKKKEVKEERTIFGQRLYKSGSARASFPPTKPKNEMKLDYTKLKPKQFSQAARINIDFDEERFPPEAKVPNKQKYDSKGRYIKHMNLVEKTQSKEVKPKSLNELTRDHSLSNPKRDNGKKGFKKK